MSWVNQGASATASANLGDDSVILRRKTRIDAPTFVGSLPSHSRPVTFLANSRSMAANEPREAMVDSSASVISSLTQGNSTKVLARSGVVAAMPFSVLSTPSSLPATSPESQGQVRNEPHQLRVCLCHMRQGHDKFRTIRRYIIQQGRQSYQQSNCFSVLMEQILEFRYCRKFKLRQPLLQPRGARQSTQRSQR